MHEGIWRHQFYVNGTRVYCCMKQCDGNYMTLNNSQCCFRIEGEFYTLISSLKITSCINYFSIHSIVHNDDGDQDMTTTTHNPTVSIDMSTTDTPIQSRSPATPAVLSTSFHPMESNTIANTNQQNITCHQQTDNQYTTIIVLIAIIVLFFVALVGLSMMLLVTCTRKQNMAESNKS